MPTETQRNFQKQMRELEKGTKDKSESSVYSYVHRDFVSNRVKVTKRRIITVSGLIGFAVMAFYLYPFASSVFNQVTAYNQEPVISYVQKMDSYDNQVNQIIQSNNTIISTLKIQSTD
jgi:hypothetical protein